MVYVSCRAISLRIEILTVRRLSLPPPRLCPSTSAPFYASRPSMQMHLLQDHVFNAINSSSAAASSVGVAQASSALVASDQWSMDNSQRRRKVGINLAKALQIVISNIRKPQKTESNNPRDIIYACRDSLKSLRAKKYSLRSQCHMHFNDLITRPTLQQTPAFFVGR